MSDNVSKTLSKLLELEEKVNKFEKSGGGGDNGDMETRVAKIESDVGNIKGRLSRIESDARALLYGGIGATVILVVAMWVLHTWQQGSIEDMGAEVAQLRADLKDSNSELRGELNGFRSELSGQISTLRSDVDEKITVLSAEVSETNKGLANIQSDLSQIKGFIMGQERPNP